jgi:hypothetical protein
MMFNFVDESHSFYAYPNHFAASSCSLVLCSYMSYQLEIESFMLEPESYMSP